MYYISMRSLLLAASVALFLNVPAALAQLDNSSFYRLDDPVIGYTARQSVDLVADLNSKIQDGAVQLTFDGERGYLRSVLAALNVPVESQIVAFSKTSGQVGLVNPQNPHAIYFNDTVAVGSVPGGFVELAAQDPQQGTIFYDLAQEKAGKPSFVRQNWCLGCHYTSVTSGVPGFFTRSMPTLADGNTVAYLSSKIANSRIDHRTPLAERWGGWYVTGQADSFMQMGNLFVTRNSKSVVNNEPLVLDSLAGKFDINSFLSPYSDVAALLVFNHQTYLMNMLTRMGWEERIGLADKREDLESLLKSAAAEIVDYMLFIDEAPLPVKMKGTSGFAEKFSAEGPFDSKGRSLRQLDLNRRLMRYPCSYMIYTAAFDGLPIQAREAIYERMWRVLSGQEKDPKYTRLSLGDRQAVVEILRDTKKGLPAYFQPLTR